MDQGACIPQRVHTIVISLQHSEDISLEKLRTELMFKVVKVVIPDKYLDDRTIYHIQPSGRFVIGGPQVLSDDLSLHYQDGLLLLVLYFNTCYI